ncbi:MAG TPA: hypothetical protein VGG74_21185 [Kofleriaceae bacterium]
MSDILEAAIRRRLAGDKISVAALFGDDLLPHLEYQLEQLSRLTPALEVLYPDDALPGEGTIDRAIRILERRR